MKTKSKDDSILKYLTIGTSHEKWGIVCTTVGYQVIKPKCRYPLSQHPDDYNFRREGRILNEYQFVYIIEGSGYFSSTSCKETKVNAGTVIMLFPGERHTYHPDVNTGWTEYWVGFKGVSVDSWIKNGFFTPSNPLLKIGISQTLIEQYNEIIEQTKSEKAGYLILISSIAFHMLGKIYYKSCNYENTPMLDKINQAKIIMRENLQYNKYPEDIANELGMSYSWFRKIFKEQTGMAPNQYQQQLKMVRAKELLSNSDLSISEVAYQLGFDSVSHFSLFFKLKEGMTATDFKKYSHPQY